MFDLGKSAVPINSMLSMIWELSASSHIIVDTDMTFESSFFLFSHSQIEIALEMKLKTNACFTTYKGYRLYIMAVGLI